MWDDISLSRPTKPTDKHPLYLTLYQHLTLPLTLCAVPLTNCTPCFGHKLCAPSYIHPKFTLLTSFCFRLIYSMTNDACVTDRQTYRPVPIIGHLSYFCSPGGATSTAAGWLSHGWHMVQYTTHVCYSVWQTDRHTDQCQSAGTCHTCVPRRRHQYSSRLTESWPALGPSAADIGRHSPVCSSSSPHARLCTTRMHATHVSILAVM